MEADWMEGKGCDVFVCFVTLLEVTMQPTNGEVKQGRKKASQKQQLKVVTRLAW
jgi:hypothetical protein